MEFDFEDPNPDIHDLFCHYNALYFQDSLGACVVSWSSKRMTLCAGVCHYLAGGGCEIRLSEPLLKFRPSSDLKNTLLHEMIHAYLWIKSENNSHSEHGPGFQKLMNEINSSSVIDHQRPYGGYHITVYHSFNDEVDNYRVHHWQCQSCGDLIKRAMNREPSANDCIVKSIHDGFCGNPSCHWHMHKMSCNGNYRKIAEPPDYKDKRKASKHGKILNFVVIYSLYFVGESSMISSSGMRNGLLIYWQAAVDMFIMGLFNCFCGKGKLKNRIAVGRLRLKARNLKQQPSRVKRVEERLQKKRKERS